MWTLTTAAYTVPYMLATGVLLYLEPLSAPVGAILLAHAWAIPELYAKRGANVLRRRPRADETAERTAVGLLGDLVGHEARDLHDRTGLVLERGALGVWLVGEAGALLITSRRAPGSTAGASTSRTAACRRRTASPICCSRCAPTSRASPPSPTWPSAERPGGSAAGCRRRSGPRSTPPSPPRAAEGFSTGCPTRGPRFPTAGHGRWAVEQRPWSS